MSHTKDDVKQKEQAEKAPLPAYIIEKKQKKGLFLKNLFQKLHF